MECTNRMIRILYVYFIANCKLLFYKMLTRKFFTDVGPVLPCQKCKRNRTCCSVASELKTGTTKLSETSVVICVIENTPVKRMRNFLFPYETRACVKCSEECSIIE